MSIKIQINSIEALERLIGGDTEIEMDIRQSVAEAFAKKHIKSLATNKVMEAAQNTVIKTITEQFFEKDNSSFVKGLVIRSSFSDAIKKQVYVLMQTEVTDRIAEVFNSNYNLKKLNEILDKQASYIADQLTNKNIEARLNQMVDAKLKQKLGL